GLNLQTAKTKILCTDEARSKITGVRATIQELHEQLREQLKEFSSGADSYATLADIEQAIELDHNSPPLGILEQAFNEHFLSPFDNRDFDKTLFHFLLTRLGRVKSRVAAHYCLTLLAERPEETEAVLRYFGDIGLSLEEKNAILRYASLPDAIYDYQLYQ